MNNLLQIYVGGAAPDVIKVVADLEFFVEQCPITAQERSGRIVFALRSRMQIAKWTRTRIFGVLKNKAENFAVFPKVNNRKRPKIL
jgi:hypothetical protein